MHIVLVIRLDLNNPRLLNLVMPNTLLYWMRTRVANQLSRNGETWAELFIREHSGTYINQWMVMDFNQFTPKSPPRENFLTVLEEAPGYVRYEDMTSTLIVSLHRLL